MPMQSWNSTTFSFVNNGSVELYTIQAPVGVRINATCSALVNREVKTQLFTIAKLLNNDTFAYSGSSPSALPLASNDTLPQGLQFSTVNGSILGAALINTDLAAYPVTCVSYPNSVPAPTDFQAFYIKNRLFVQAWGKYGEVNDQTGLMANFWASNSSIYPSDQIQPYFCSVFWVGINSYGTTSYSANIVSVAFHTIRNSAQPYMVFSDNSQFNTYQLYLLFGAIPFWALTLACILLYPSLICFKRWCFCKFGFCLRKPVATSKKSISKSKSSSSFRKTARTETKGEWSQWSCLRQCCFVWGRRKRNQTVAEGSSTIPANKINNSKTSASPETATVATSISPPLTGTATTPSATGTLLEQANRKATTKRTTFLLDPNEDETFEDTASHEDDDSDDESKGEIEEADQIVAKYQRQLNRILVSTSISKRLCFLFVAVFICGCISGLLVGFFQTIAEFSDEYISARTMMGIAHNASLEAYGILNDDLIPSSSSSIQQLLILERDRVSRFASFANPPNLRMQANLFPTFLMDSHVQTTVESVIFAIQILAPILTILSLSLASCTCKWNDYVLFENLSIFVGMSLRAYLIICAILAWFIVMFFFWNVSVVSDVCYLPSILYVPELNSSQPILTQPVAYNPDSNSYTLANGENLATFFSSCLYKHYSSLSEPNANPYSVLAVEASQLNAQAKSLTPIINLSFQARLNRLETLFQQMYLPMQCSKFGQFITAGTSVFCSQVLIGNFLTFFFLCTIGITYMITAPCTHWIAPNLYRQWQANKLYERASRQTEKLIKFTSSTIVLKKLGSVRTEREFGNSFKGNGHTSSFRNRVPSMRKSSHPSSKSLNSSKSSSETSFNNKPTPKRLGEVSPPPTLETIPSDPLITSPPTTVSSNNTSGSNPIQRGQPRFFSANSHEPSGTNEKEDGDDAETNHDLSLI